jgi:hypothetical protein
MHAADFRAAVDSYDFRAPAAPPHSGASLLLGNAHGLRVDWEPALYYRLIHDIDARAVAFEWSFDELGPIVAALRATGRLDTDALWSLPEGAEAFSGDGRFTAGHVALLERLLAEERLAQMICFDRVAASQPERSEEMAVRLAHQWNRDNRLFAVVGAGHLPVFRKHLPELSVLDLRYDGATHGTAVVPER